MKTLHVILTMAILSAVLCMGLCCGMNGKEKVVLELPSPSGDVTAIQTYQSGFADDSACVYLKGGRFVRRHRLNDFWYIFDIRWSTSPEELHVKYTHVFGNNDKRVYVDRFGVDGSKVSSKVVGHYVSSPDGSTAKIVPLPNQITNGVSTLTSTTTNQPALRTD